MLLENKENLIELLEELTVEEQAELLMKISDSYEDYIELESGWIISDHLKYDDLGKDTVSFDLGTNLNHLLEQGIIEKYLYLGDDFYAFKKKVKR
jgi:hypothetical protein